MKKIYVTQHHIVVAALLFCLMTLFVILNAVAVPLAYAAANNITDDKEEISSKTVTGYYVTVPLAAVGQFRRDDTEVDLGYRRKAFTRSVVNITAIVVFRDIKTENGIVRNGNCLHFFLDILSSEEIFMHFSRRYQQRGRTF